MTLTLASDCSQIELSSTELELTNSAVELTIIHNRNTTYSPDIDANQISPITIDASLLGQDSINLLDGVYYFKLKITKSNSTIVEESACIAVLCGVKCSILDWYKDINANIDKILSYEALKVANNCVQCNCALMNTLYDNIINSQTNDCGCE